MESFNAALGLEVDPQGPSIALEARAEHQVAAGTIHFAVIATVAEVAAAQAVGVAVVPAASPAPAPAASSDGDGSCVAAEAWRWPRAR
jgi:hypothetical protein